MRQGDGGAGARGKSLMRNRERHRASIICYLVFASSVPFLNVGASLAQELSVEERACIISAVAKLPQAAALKIERSRAYPDPSRRNPDPSRRNPDPYRILVEIDVGVAGHTSTYMFNCILHGQLTVIQPLGMR
jgi:hypothetical protein